MQLIPNLIEAERGGEPKVDGGCILYIGPKEKLTKEHFLLKDLPVLIEGKRFHYVKV